MSIYTKTGDKGETSLVNGTRVGKDDPRICVVGAIDELNSHIGMLIAMISDNVSTVRYTRHTCDYLFGIQNDLFVIGSILGLDIYKTVSKHIPIFEQDKIDRLEKEIDQISADLPPLKNFILPGGAMTIAQTHICRTVCRRAEREFVKCAYLYKGPRLYDTGLYQFSVEETNSAIDLSNVTIKTLDESYRNIQIYLNRLSDYLFVCARELCCNVLGIPEVIWKSQ